MKAYTPALLYARQTNALTTLQLPLSPLVWAVHRLPLSCTQLVIIDWVVECAGGAAGLRLGLFPPLNTSVIVVPSPRSEA